MKKPLVLSLFPGADLFGRAFELQGCCVVKGPDLLLGHDVRDWPLPPGGAFDGVIAGPPCQPHSRARNISGGESRHDDMMAWTFAAISGIGPKWAVVENVPLALESHPIPQAWGAVKLDDWSCGGHTFRERLFYVYPRSLVARIPVPPERCGSPQWSVLASSNKDRGEKFRGHRSLTPRLAGELQGWPEIATALLQEADVGKKGNRLIGARLIVHYLGNGVPRAMGEWIARHVVAAGGVTA